MAISIVETAGSATANSYVTLTQAQDQTLRTLEVVVVLTILVVELGGRALVVEEINCL